METDRSIINRVLAGDTEEYARLVDRHKKSCVTYATKMLGDQDEAEDVVQEALVRAYRSLRQCRNPDRFDAWLRKILVNRCWTAMQRRTTQERRFVRRGVEETIARAEIDPAQSSDKDAVDLALLRLPPLYREALGLKYTDGLTYAEMAEITGSSVSALKKRVKRGMAKLQAILKRK